MDPLTYNHAITTPSHYLRSPFLFNLFCTSVSKVCLHVPLDLLYLSPCRLQITAWKIGHMQKNLRFKVMKYFSTVQFAISPLTFITLSTNISLFIISPFTLGHSQLHNAFLKYISTSIQQQRWRDMKQVTNCTSPVLYLSSFGLALRLSALPSCSEDDEWGHRTGPEIGNSDKNNLL